MTVVYTQGRYAQPTFGTVKACPATGALFQFKPLVRTSTIQTNLTSLRIACKRILDNTSNLFSALLSIECIDLLQLSCTDHLIHKNRKMTLVRMAVCFGG